MLAKVPAKRSIGKSSFAALTRYINRDAAAITHSPEVWSVETAAGEMEQVASFSRAADPVYHYILSWREGEHPTDAQAFDAVTATLTALRMHDNQWVAAVHRTTRNVHAHVAVNRVHPETFKAVSVFRDWLVLDRTCREIEILQGWRHDRGPHRIEVAAGTEPQIVRHQRERSDDLPTTPSTRARDYEAWNGRESFQSWLGKEPAQSLKRALEQTDLSWQGVHRTLAAFNLECRIKSSGAVIVDRTAPERLHAKASHLGRFASRGKLEARLGPYEGPAGAPFHAMDKSYRTDVEESGRRTHDREGYSVLRERFEKAAVEWHKTQEYVGHAARQRQRESELKRYVQLREANQALCERIRNSRQGGNRRLLYTVASVGTAVKREALRNEIRQERSNLRAQLSRHGPGSWRAWLVREADAGDPIASQELGHLRRRIASDLRLDRHLSDTKVATRQGQTLNAIFGRLTAFGNASGVYFLAKGRAIFCDQGARIVFHDLSDDYIKAGLALAREKWNGGIYLAGSQAFREKATALAADLGITVRGGALQRQVPDLEELSRRYAKPTRPCELVAGRQYTGKLVAAVQGTGGGLVVIDAGRELIVIHADEKTAASLQHKVGTWVRAHAANDRPRDGVVSELAWRIRELQRKGPEHGVGFG